jgi:hypothetical protein
MIGDVNHPVRVRADCDAKRPHVAGRAELDPQRVTWGRCGGPAPGVRGVANREHLSGKAPHTPPDRLTENHSRTNPAGISVSGNSARPGH